MRGAGRSFSCSEFGKHLRFQEFLPEGLRNGPQQHARVRNERGRNYVENCNDAIFVFDSGRGHWLHMVGVEMKDLLDEQVIKAVNKVLERYAEPEFFEGLGEPLSSALRNICADCIRVGVAMGTILVDGHPFRPITQETTTTHGKDEG